MGIISKVKSWFKPQAQAEVRAAYDVLDRRGDTDTWQGVTRESANTFETRERRQSLRDMARYERRNNPHLQGLISKVSNEVVGCGPRLSIEPRTITPNSIRAANRLEETWVEYSEETQFVEKLRLMATERPVGGESFTTWYPNPRLETVPVGVTVYEGDQFESDAWTFNEYANVGRGMRNDGPIDGVYQDSYGNITGYERLKYHPYSNVANYNETLIVDESACFHWFRKDRPSQYRGVSEVAPMLDIYNNIRRFIESKVRQEELRAKMMGSISTGFAPDSGCADLGDQPIDMLIGDGQFTTLPDGWKVDMFKFDATANGLDEFMRVSLSWATQALLVPWNVAAGDSSDYNFASGRLDFISFYHYVDILRKQLEKQFLCKFVKQWADFAKLNRQFPSGLGNYKCVWRWDKREMIDPAKQANADKTLKEAGLLDIQDYAARLGQNADEFAEKQIRHEVMRMKIRQDIEKELGVTPVQEKQPEQPEDTNQGMENGDTTAT